MTTEPMFTPPTSGLIRQWMSEAGAYQREERYYEVNLVTQAAKWGYQQGADQELDACCEWLASETPETYISALRATRRPKPPSLKEQALETLKYPKDLWSEADVDTIRRALEALPND